MPTKSYVLRDTPITAIDFETTGLSVDHGDRAIEVALVKHYPNGEVEHWDALINPQTAIPLKTQAIHNITDAMVENAPTFDQIYPQLKRLIANSIVVAHNAPFDIGFLHSECRQHNLPYPINGPVLDTLMMARYLFGLPRCNLTSVATRFGLIVHNAHRAMFDARNTLHSFLQMLKELNLPPNITAKQFLQTIEEYKPNGKKRLQMMAQLKQANREKRPVKITYFSSDPERPLHLTRDISINAIRPPHVIAHCFLREGKRHFRINRIFAVEASQKLML